MATHTGRGKYLYAGLAAAAFLFAGASLPQTAVAQEAPAAMSAPAAADTVAADSAAPAENAALDGASADSHAAADDKKDEAAVAADETPNAAQDDSEADKPKTRRARSVDEDEDEEAPYDPYAPKNMWDVTNGLSVGASGAGGNASLLGYHWPDAGITPEEYAKHNEELLKDFPNPGYKTTDENKDLPTPTYVADGGAEGAVAGPNILFQGGLLVRNNPNVTMFSGGMIPNNVVVDGAYIEGYGAVVNNNGESTFSRNMLADPFSVDKLPVVDIVDRTSEGENAEPRVLSPQEITDKIRDLTDRMLVNEMAIVPVAVEVYPTAPAVPGSIVTPFTKPEVLEGAKPIRFLAPRIIVKTGENAFAVCYNYLPNWIPTVSYNNPDAKLGSYGPSLLGQVNWLDKDGKIAYTYDPSLDAKVPEGIDPDGELYKAPAIVRAFGDPAHPDNPSRTDTFASPDIEITGLNLIGDVSADVLADYGTPMFKVYLPASAVDIKVPGDYVSLGSLDPEKAQPNTTMNIGGKRVTVDRNGVFHFESVADFEHVLNDQIGVLDMDGNKATRDFDVSKLLNFLRPLMGDESFANFFPSDDIANGNYFVTIRDEAGDEVQPGDLRPNVRYWVEVRLLLDHDLNPAVSYAYLPSKTFSFVVTPPPAAAHPTQAVYSVKHALPETSDTNTLRMPAVFAVMGAVVSACALFLRKRSQA